jgi:hypothetical protein
MSIIKPSLDEIWINNKHSHINEQNRLSCVGSREVGPTRCNKEDAAEREGNRFPSASSLVVLLFQNYFFLSHAQDIIQVAV